MRVADDVFAEALTFQQIGTSLAQTDQTRKRVSGESAHILPVLQVKSGAEGGVRQDEYWLVLSRAVPSRFLRVFGYFSIREYCPVPSGTTQFVSFWLAVLS